MSCDEQLSQLGLFSLGKTWFRKVYKIMKGMKRVGRNWLLPSFSKTGVSGIN